MYKVGHDPVNSMWVRKRVKVMFVKPHGGNLAQADKQMPKQANITCVYYYTVYPYTECKYPCSELNGSTMNII